MSKSPTKTIQFYNGLKDTIYPLVTLGLKNVCDIQRGAKTYIESQTFIKNVGKRIAGNDLIIYMIGERFIDLALEQVKQRNKEDSTFKLSYQEFEEYIFRKIHGIGLFHIQISTPESVPSSLIHSKRDYMKKEFNKLSKPQEFFVRESNVVIMEQRYSQMCLF